MAVGRHNTAVMAGLVMATLSTGATADESSESVPTYDLPPMHLPAVRHSDAMMQAGMLLVGLGGFSTLAGGLVLRTAGSDGAPDEALPGGIAMLAGGLGAVGIGVPLWLVGAEKTTGTHAAVVIDTAGVGWRLRF